MTRIKFLALILFVTVWSAHTSVHAQSWDWLKNAGGLRADKASTVVVDDSGFIYIAGFYNEQGFFDAFDTGFSYTSSKEAFVAKLDSLGNFIWVRNGTNYYDDRALGLCVDPFGNVYITGTCWGGLNWGSLSLYNSTSYTDQIFVIKLDGNGNEIWMKNAGVDETGFWYSDDHGLDLASDSQGNIFVTGFISNNDNVPNDAHFDLITIPMQPSDSLAFVAKLSNNGTWQWVETFDGIYLHRDNAVAVDNEDNVYVTGGFAETSTFGSTTLTSFGEQDIYVVKYDNNGNFQFVVQVGGPLTDRGDDITYGNDEHLYITGEFRDEVLFGSDDLNNYGSPDDKDIFVAKMTKAGEWIWATKAGSAKGGDRGTGICANDQGNIFVSGQYKGQASFGDINVDAEEGEIEIFVAAIDTLGKWRWVLEGGGPFDDRATSVAVDMNCNVYTTGYFESTISLGELDTNAIAGKDIFVAKVKDGCFGYAPPPSEEEDPILSEFEILETNVFSPNGDGVNDWLLFTHSENVKGKIVITNRWGNVVFETSTLLLPWNGNDTSGKPVTEGTYFYTLEWEVATGEKDQRHGFITLIR